jgi:polysaccharide pyruvyl transferase WcaK-like protein
VSRPCFILSGFFGRGNCGDEAILQVQYERFSPYYDLIVSVDERGAYDGFWNWYPYDRCRVVHQGNLAVVAERQVVGIHVGGGGLPHGFNAAQVVYARSHGKRAFLTGVDAREPVAPGSAQALKQYLSLFDFVSVRSTAAWKTMSTIVDRCHLGTDWALALATDEGVPRSDKSHIVLTVREFPLGLISEKYIGSLKRLLSILKDEYEQITLLPFCPEDERFLDALPLFSGTHREIHWWNPRRVQAEVARADLVISIGRLHPLVFAANVNIPAVFAEPMPVESDWPFSMKAEQLCGEHGWPYFSSIEDLASALKGRQRFPAPRFSRQYHERWEAMAQGVEQRL